MDEVSYKGEINLKLEWEGEFGWEILTCVGYAYYLYLRGELESTSSYKDTRCLYFFSPNHIEREGQRTNRNSKRFPIKDIHVRDLDTSQWRMPDYASKYKNNTFKFDRPHIVICNKYCIEWDSEPVNFIDTATLTSLIDSFEKRGFLVIYNRPSPREIIGDNSQILDLGEKGLLKKRFPSVLFMEEIYSEYSFNETQMMIMANSDSMVSVQGGSAVLCSLFGRPNYIYAKQGGEVDFDSYNTWFKKLSGAPIKTSNTYEKLLSICQ